VSSAKADWHLADLLDATEDPFDTMIYSSGLTVDLTGSEEDLAAAVAETLAMERRLFERGVICDLKDNGQDCQTCPMPMSDERGLHPLCRVGKDQFNLLGRLAQRKRTRQAPFVEIARAVGEFVELGHLNAHDAELLTAVGM
jgi:hypothetical protein